MSDSLIKKDFIVYVYVSPHCRLSNILRERFDAENIKYVIKDAISNMHIFDFLFHQGIIDLPVVSIFDKLTSIYSEEDIEDILLEVMNYTHTFQLVDNYIKRNV